MSALAARTGLAGSVAVAAAALLALVPRAAAACAVCSAGREDETRTAFLITTLFLSVLPLGMLGGAAWWLLRRARRAAAGGVERAEPSAPAVVSRSASSR